MSHLRQGCGGQGRGLFWLLASVIWSLVLAPASAQVDMPDPSAMAGLPLPAPELPARTVSVRVVRERMCRCGEPAYERV